MNMLSKRAKNLKPSPTLSLAAKAKALRDEGKSVISLSVGEPDWDTFEEIKQRGIQAIQEGKTKYSPSAGIPDLRKAIAAQTNSDIGTDYKMENVSVTAGGKFCIFGVIHCTIEAEDEVIIPAPYWVSYPDIVELAEGRAIPVVCGRESQFKLTAEKLAAAITEKTKMLILNSPSNPTGYMYSAEELKDIAEVLKKHPNILILSDDIYNKLVFNDRNLSPHILEVAPELTDRCIVINGLSKSYSMTGWRLGWTIGPQELISALNKYQSQSVSCAATFTQEAAVVAVSQMGQKVKDSVKDLVVRRDFAVQGINAIDALSVEVPDGAFYLWVDISKTLGRTHQSKLLEGSHDFCAALLEEKGLVVVPGKDFGLEGFVRMSYAVSQETMTEALQHLNSFISNLE